MSAPENSWPRAIYSTSQVREFDRRAIAEFGVDGFELMQRAASFAFGFLKSEWPEARTLRVYCGAGNNAGDGYVVASLAAAEGFDARVIAVLDADTLQGDASAAVELARAAGVAIVPFDDTSASDSAAADVVIDALLGTGLTRDVEGVLGAAVAAINSEPGPVLALDIPTGLDSDTGMIRGAVVVADATVTFGGLKTGLFLGAGPAYRGRLAFTDLDLPAEAIAGADPKLTRIDQDAVQLLGLRSRTSHKGLNGRVLIVGGGPGMAGAVRLAAEAALRSGAGLVYAAVAPECSRLLTAGRPEVICRGVDDPADLADWLELADVLVVGPGLGQSDWGQRLARAMLAIAKPLVLDADGLNFLAGHRQTRDNWVLTPHAGEAGRLLDLAPAEIQGARDVAVARLARDYEAIAVLKGACSLVSQVAENNTVHTSVCDYGNPGMATAGMGDVLSGVIGGLIAQFGLTAEVVECAVLVHALAGDDAAADGERGMIASDLFRHIRRRVNPA